MSFLTDQTGPGGTNFFTIFCVPQVIKGSHILLVILVTLHTLPTLPTSLLTEN